MDRCFLRRSTHRGSRQRPGWGIAAIALHSHLGRLCGVALLLHRLIADASRRRAKYAFCLSRCVLTVFALALPVVHAYMVSVGRAFRDRLKVPQMLEKERGWVGAGVLHVSRVRNTQCCSIGLWLMLTKHIVFRGSALVAVSCAAVYLGRRLTLPTEGGQPQGIASIRRCLRRHQAGPARPHQTSGRRRGAKPTRTRGRRGPLSEDT